MNSQLIRERWQQDTKPFVSRLSDGTRVKVAHPDFMMMPPGFRVSSFSRRVDGKPALIQCTSSRLKRFRRGGCGPTGNASRDAGSMLNIKTVRERLNKSPFKPFNIRHSDGRKIHVGHPDFVSVGGSVVFVTDLDDNLQEIDSLHIVSLDPAPARKRNGKRSR